MQQTVILPKVDRAASLARLSAALSLLPEGKSWRVRIEEARSTRSEEQNNYLWGVCYPTILEQESMRGWESKDLHEYFLGEHFGWVELDGFGRKRMKPNRRSRRLSISEFSEYIAFIQRRMAEIGVYIPDPGELAA